MISGFREAQPTTGRRYLLSAMLGVTRARGTSIDEAIDILRRAAEADSTRPKGTFVFQKTGNVRTTTRSPGFDSTAVILEAMGHKTKVVSNLNQAKQLSIVGLMTGMSNVPLADVELDLMPGAIAENLTSYGGIMKPSGKHTPLTEFLLEGAAGSSGTVIEPFALQEKFPHPFIHVHYARGVSLIEAFYLSLASPSQMLIVGDPLCTPWKRQVAVEMSLVERDETETTLTVNVKAVPGEVPAATIDVFIDGKFRVRVPVREEITIRVEELEPGAHELTLIATSAHPLRSTKRQPFQFKLRK